MYGFVRYCRWYEFEKHKFGKKRRVIQAQDLLSSRKVSRLIIRCAGQSTSLAQLVYKLSFPPSSNKFFSLLTKYSLDKIPRLLVSMNPTRIIRSPLLIRIP